MVSPGFHPSSLTLSTLRVYTAATQQDSRKRTRQQHNGIARRNHNKPTRKQRSKTAGRMTTRQQQNHQPTPAATSLVVFVFCIKDKASYHTRLLSSMSLASGRIMRHRTDVLASGRSMGAFCGLLNDASREDLCQFWAVGSRLTLKTTAHHLLFRACKNFRSSSVTPLFFPSHLCSPA